MAFRQKVKSALVIGKKATIMHGGMEYSGEVIEFETMAPQDAHVTIKSDDGSSYIIPISPTMVVVIPPINEVESIEDEESSVVKPKDEKAKAKPGKTK
jgi:hypothetical protein